MLAGHTEGATNAGAASLKRKLRERGRQVAIRGERVRRGGVSAGCVAAPSTHVELARRFASADPPAPVLSDAPPLSAGSLVRVRRRTYLVQDVRTAPGTSAIVQLACVDDDAQGQRLDVIRDAETDARILPAGRSALKSGHTPDEPRTFAAYPHALRWGCVTSTDPSLFQAPLRAGIVLESYQLEGSEPLAPSYAVKSADEENVFVLRVGEAGFALAADLDAAGSDNRQNSKHADQAGGGPTPGGTPSAVRRTRQQRSSRQGRCRSTGRGLQGPCRRTRGRDRLR